MRQGHAGSKRAEPTEFQNHADKGEKKTSLNPHAENWKAQGTQQQELIVRPNRHTKKPMEELNFRIPRNKIRQNSIPLHYPLPLGAAARVRG